MSPVGLSRAWRSVAAGAAAAAVLSLARPARCDAPSTAPSLPAAPKPAPPTDPAEGKPARPAALPPLPIKPLPWERMLDIGGDFAVCARSASMDRQGNPSAVRYGAATGFAFHIRWPILKWLQIEGYYLDIHMPIGLPKGSLGLQDKIAARGGGVPNVETFAFGARVSPKLTLGPVTLSFTAGAGWGRFEFQRMFATTPSGQSYVLRERGGSFVEFPIGVGFSWEIVKRWLSFDLQATAAPVVEMHGEAFDPSQAVDPSGKLVNVGPLPIMDASLVQTIGFSLLL